MAFGAGVSGATVFPGGSNQRIPRPQPTGVEGAPPSAVLWMARLQRVQSMETAARASGDQSRDTRAGRD